MEGVHSLSKYTLALWKSASDTARDAGTTNVTLAVYGEGMSSSKYKLKH